MHYVVIGSSPSLEILTWLVSEHRKAKLMIYIVLWTSIRRVLASGQRRFRIGRNNKYLVRDRRELVAYLPNLPS